MQLIVCLDDNNGMSFGHRRLSRDRVVIERILELTAGKELCATGYSAALFDGCEREITLIDDISNISEADFCFVENLDVSHILYEINKLFVFRWNRRYPSDLKLRIPADFQMILREDFPGNSHDRITMEVYKK